MKKEAKRTAVKTSKKKLGAESSAYAEHFSKDAFLARKKKPKNSKKKPRSTNDRIRGDMIVADITALLPDAEPILRQYGLHCFSCPGGSLETLAEGCRSHGFGEEDIAELVEDLNDRMTEGPSRPEKLVVTLAAAGALRDVMAQEGKVNQGLLVIADGHGGFCMEFREEASGDEQTFTHPEAPDVRVLASILTLRRLGGSTIDFREGRFKLDLPEDKRKDCCKSDGICDCRKI